jgi:hypothetical protein
LGLREGGPIRATRLIAAGLLAAFGVGATVVGLVEISKLTAQSVGPLRQAVATADAQRFAFDRQAWRAVALDTVFPPAYTPDSALPDLGPAGDAARANFTRVGIAQAAGCAAAFDPALARMLGPGGCGPVLRVDYTDATRTLVATVGVAILSAGPDREHDLHFATTAPHDDLRPRAAPLPGTPAAAFGDAQRVAYRVLASDRAPFLSFAVVGFGDGRPAASDPDQTAAGESGAQLMANELQDMAGSRLEQATDDEWAHRR